MNQDIDNPAPSATPPPPQPGLPKPSVFDRIKGWYHALPDKKRYVEFFSALLSIPVLVTVIILNINNLKSESQQKLPSPTQPPAVVTIIQRPPRVSSTPAPVPTATITPTPSPTPTASCIQAVGPVSISAPDEGDVVTGDPVCLVIDRQGEDYCGVVWSYQINGGPWSDFTDNTICMYGLTPGAKTLNLRVQSLVSSDEVSLSRNFTVAGGGPAPTTAPTPASASATPTN